MKKTLVAAILALLLSGMACAISIGVSPSTVNFEEVVKGGYAEGYFTLSTSGMDNLSCSVTYTGPIRDWLAIDSGSNFVLPGKSGKVVKIIIQPPADANNGPYEGKINVNAAPTTGVEGGAGLAVGAGVEIKVKANVVGYQIASVKINGFDVADTEVDYPAEANIVVSNDGNIALDPKFTIYVMDENGVVLLTRAESTITDLKPTQYREVTFEFNTTGVPVGFHMLNMTVTTKEGVEKHAKANFTVHPEGTYSIKGALKQLTISSNKVEAGNPVKITGIFENTGRTKTKAKLVGEIYLNDKIVKNFESNEVLVKTKDLASLETFYTPEKTGKYVVNAYVQYGDQQTNREMASFETEGTNYLVYIIPIILVIVIIAVYLKYYKKTARERKGL